MDIDGAVVLVTGASSGIGAATARAAAHAGAHVVLAARRQDRIEQLAGELSDALSGALPVRCDVTHADQVARAVRAALGGFGRIDALINVAGQGLQATIEDIDCDEFRELLDLNLVAPLLTMQAVIPHMREQGGGSIVNVGSGISFAAIPGSGAYAASKAGLAKLSAVARTELADAGIVVSTMYPFVTHTEFIDSVRGDQQAAKELEANDAPEPQKPEQVADAILRLIRTGAEHADLVPEKFGGTYRG